MKMFAKKMPNGKMAYSCHCPKCGILHVYAEAGPGEMTSPAHPNYWCKDCASKEVQGF